MSKFSKFMANPSKVHQDAGKFDSLICKINIDMYLVYGGVSLEEKPCSQDVLTVDYVA